MNITQKNNVLKTLASLLIKNKRGIIGANHLDVSANLNADKSIIDRLKVDENKILEMVSALNQAIKKDDPEGKILYSYRHKNGLKIENKTVPFGKILVIYESRPDVTIEAATAGFKAGNKVLLKGGKEARETNIFLTKLWQKALSVNKLEKNYITYLDLNREETQSLIKNSSRKIDLIISRGGPKLINFVAKNANVPVIISGRGNNFLYIDKESDFDMAVKIIINGKQKVNVCNALDKVLIHKDIPDIKLKILNLVDNLKNNKIKILGDKNVYSYSGQIQKVKEKTVFGEEFLSSKILLSLVKNSDEAINIINDYSGGHSASIITTNNQTAKKFQSDVDCAAVYHNASTRFTDGGQFGFGIEMAISTQKLHFRGPIGINQLVTNKWFICGHGQIRK